MANKLKAVPADSTTPVLDTSKIPKGERLNIGQVIFDAVQHEFQNPTVQPDYERWRAEQGTPPMNDQTQLRPEHTPEPFYQPSNMEALRRSIDEM